MFCFDGSFLGRRTSQDGPAMAKEHWWPNTGDLKGGIPLDMDMYIYIY